MSTIKNNTLIAIFMGLVPVTDEQVSGYEVLNYPNGIVIDFAKYHTSWDALIPVIEKCKELQIFGSQRLITNIENRLVGLDLMGTYRNVVEFILYYNQNKL